MPKYNFEERRQLARKMVRAKMNGDDLYTTFASGLSSVSGEDTKTTEKRIIRMAAYGHQTENRAFPDGGYL